MHSHLATSMFEKLQGKNEDNSDELQKKEQEYAQKSPLNKERVDDTSPTYL